MPKTTGTRQDRTRPAVAGRARPQSQPQPPARVPGNLPLLVLLVVVVAALAVFALAFNSKNRTTDLFSDKGMPSDSYQVPLGVSLGETQPQDPFAGWNTYKNASGTFEFRYPANWQAKAEGQAVRITYPQATGTDILVAYSAVTSSLDTYVSALDQASLTAFEGKPSVTVKSQSKEKVNGYAAVQRLQAVNAAGLEQKITYLYDQGRILSVSTAMERIGGEWEQAYDLILSSFRFIAAPVATASTTVSSTASAQAGEYRSQAYGFSLSYDQQLKPKTADDGIEFNSGEETLLRVKGISSPMPSLLDYHPSGASVEAQVVVGGKQAMKFSAARKVGVADGKYVQYVVAIDGGKWLKVEYQAAAKDIAGFEKIISTIKF